MEFGNTWPGASMSVPVYWNGHSNDRNNLHDFSSDKMKKIILTVVK